MTSPRPKSAMLDPFPDSTRQNLGEPRERRLSPRIYEDFPVTVRGVDDRGRKFRTETVVDNLSAHGLFVRIGVLMKRGARLLTLVRISPAEERTAPAPLVALKGVITRVVPLADGRFGVGVQFTHYRFL